MMMVARKRRGDGDELLSPLVMPALLVAQALQTLLRAAATETLGDDPEPRSGLMEVVNQLSGAAEILESMTPRQFRES
jgi:hypothetical protein